jgi:hypothetical protein
LCVDDFSPCLDASMADAREAVEMVIDWSLVKARRDEATAER